MRGSRGGCGITQRGSPHWGGPGWVPRGQRGAGPRDAARPRPPDPQPGRAGTGTSRRGTDPRDRPPPGQTPGPHVPHHAGLTCTMALEPITSRTCPLRLVPLGSAKFTISAYWANWRVGGRVRGVGGIFCPPRPRPCLAAPAHQLCLSFPSRGLGVH